MTDVATGETPAEPVLPIPPPAPEAPAELEVAPEGAEPEADATALPEIEYPIGSTRQAILDHFLDTEGDQTMAQIKAALPTVLPTTVEASVRREWQQGRLLRVGPGLYRLAPPKLAEAKPAPQPTPTPTDEAIWFDALERWAVDRSWDSELGPPPDAPNNDIPAAVKVRFNDRVRKREERRREAEAVATTRAAADRELRDKLIAATGGNIVRGPALDDLAPIRAAMELVPHDRILSAIRSKTDKKLFPGNEPATSWRAERLLREIAESFTRTDIVPNLIAAWAAAGKTPAKAQNSLPPDAPMADIKRSHHDRESAPASSPPQPVAIPDDGPAIARAPDQLSRQSILAAFARTRTPPSPQPPQPRPAERLWFAGPEALQPESVMTDDGWRFVLEGYVARNVAWASKHGPRPGTRGCRVSRRVLKEFGFETID